MITKLQVVAIARDAVCELALRTGLSAPRQNVDGLTIVTFHRILSEAERNEYPVPGLAVTPEELDFCLAYLKKHYSCHPMGEAFERLQSGEKRDKPLAAITFDDGQLDNLENACPVLEKHELRATFYIVPRMTDAQEPLWHDRLGFSALAALRQEGEALETLSERSGVRREDHESDVAFVSAVMLAVKQLEPEVRKDLVDIVSRLADGAPPTWARLMRPDEVIEMHKAGHEIGSHTNLHSLLPQCDDKELEKELIESKSDLETWLGQSVDHFCYPNGDHDDRTQKAVATAGYKTGVTTTFGVNQRSSDPYQLGRFDITSRSLRNRRGKLKSARLAWGLSRFRRER
ncbi:MAG: polysaccharide deacetylase family protein [bacterium]|nr:polysaccharide deacetylase family protein [bacterium]